MKRYYANFSYGDSDDVSCCPWWSTSHTRTYCLCKFDFSCILSYTHITYTMVRASVVPRFQNSSIAGFCYLAHCLTKQVPRTWLLLQQAGLNTHSWGSVGNNMSGLGGFSAPQTLLYILYPADGCDACECRRFNVKRHWICTSECKITARVQTCEAQRTLYQLAETQICAVRVSERQY